MVSEVGHLSEHPETEKLLLHKGIHAMNDSELLQMYEKAFPAEQQ